MNIDRIEERRSTFKCPKCSSPYFGTDLRTNTGYCHGQRIYNGPFSYKIIECDFTWSRKNDNEAFV